MATKEKEEKVEKMQPVGLECLSDDALAAIIEEATRENDGELKYPHQILAFEELARRSGREIR